jgi:alkaline phosphatase
MFKKFRSVLLTSVCLLAMTGMSFAASTPRYVFYFIGDGLGPSQRQAAEYYYKMETGDKNAKLTMNSFPVAALVTTHSNNTLITDSAAGGTALASGIKTINGMIGKLPDGTNVPTLTEAAIKQGYATGIVTTTRLTHATPAAFTAHNVSRNNANAIAVDQLNSNVDFFAGGGYRYFVAKNNPEGLKSKRKDDRNLVKEFKGKGYTTFIGDDARDAFRNYDPQKGDKVMAALAYSHIPYEVARRNSELTKNKILSLAEMTEKAVTMLDKQEKPFFIMVEGGRIDHACHAHDATSAILDTIAFDEAIRVAYEFYKKHPEETLIVTAADHETGGIGLGISMDKYGYFLKLKELGNVTVSAEDNLNKKYNKMVKKIADVSKRHNTFIAYAEAKWGLTDRTAAEDKELRGSMVTQDNNQALSPEEKTLYGYAYTPTMVAVTNIISQRARISWTSFVHTGTVIPASAIGFKSELFAGFIDNTDIPKTFAKIMNANLSATGMAASEALLGETVGPQKKASLIPYK